MIDFNKFREIADEVGAFLLADIAHIAGLVAAGLHPSPVGIADIVTSTTHKTLKRPRGGIILTNNEELAKGLNFNIFPGIQGSPRACYCRQSSCFGEALEPEFIEYQQQVIDNAQALSNKLKSLGAEIVSGGTDNHLVLVKTNNYDISGKQAERVLEDAGITCNKNMIPGDQRSPFVTSGIRLGTPALTTRGFQEKEIEQVAVWIHEVLGNPENKELHLEIKMAVKDLCAKFPVY